MQFIITLNKNFSVLECRRNFKWLKILDDSQQHPQALFQNNNKEDITSFSSFLENRIRKWSIFRLKNRNISISFDLNKRFKRFKLIFRSIYVSSPLNLLIFRSIYVSSPLNLLIFRSIYVSSPLYLLIFRSIYVSSPLNLLIFRSI